MRHTNLSLFGVIIGLFVTFSSAVRYFILYPDPDKGLFFALIGLLIIGVAWNYAGRIQLKEKIDRLQITLTDVEQYMVDKESIGVNNKYEI